VLSGSAIALVLTGVVAASPAGINGDGDRLVGVAQASQTGLPGAEIEDILKAISTLGRDSKIANSTPANSTPAKDTKSIADQANELGAKLMLKATSPLADRAQGRPDPCRMTELRKT
jgi:hypothetical protein